MADRRRWDEVESHLDALLELEESQRGRALEELARAGVDPEVVARLESCLDESFLCGSAERLVPELWSEAADAASAADDPWLGRQLGAWRVVEPLGEGGMGRVYLVERADGQYAQRAALKLLARAERPELLERFRLERQILARLDHPHIARLLDGGTTADGHPWLVLERIDGDPIDAWCDRAGLGVAGRLRLFLQVCAAVGHAHRQLVVHRDLKPGNILVTADGQVRLLDFGIAQLAGTGDAPENAPRRAFPALTPGYAAPEQVRGEEASPATDVWALGVLLHRLLVGEGPFAAGNPDAAELVRRTLESSPTMPSSAAGDRRLARRLRGDLDAIVARALRPRALDRYASAHELAADIELHLAERPVAARPATVPLRVAKFVRRHRLGAVLASIAAVLLVGALATAVDRVRRVERERERAERVTAFLTDLLAIGDPARGEGFHVAADSLLRRAFERAESELSDRPDLQAAVFHQVGEALLRLRLPDDSRAALERAVALRRELEPGGSDDLAESLVRYGYTFERSERVEEGVPPMEEAVAILRRLHGDDARVADALLELATYASRFVESDHPQRDELRVLARDRYREAHEIYRRHLGEPHPKIGEVLRNFAFATDDRSEAIALLERAVVEHESAGAPTQGLGYAWSDLGMLLESAGRHDEAERSMRRALETLESVEGDNALIELTVTNNLAGILRDRGKYAEAEPLYREVLARRERLLPHDGVGRAYALYGLGRVALGLGNAREAELHLVEAVVLLTEAKRTILAAIARGWLGEAYAVQGRSGEAERHAEASLNELQGALGEEEAQVAEARARLARLRRGELPPAAPFGTPLGAALGDGLDGSRGAEDGP